MCARAGGSSGGGEWQPLAEAELRSPGDELARRVCNNGDADDRAMWGFAPRYTPPKAAEPVAAPAPAPEVREQRELDNLADLVAVTVELAEKVGMDLVLRDGSSLQRVLGDAKKLSKLRKMPLVSGGESTPSRASAPAAAPAAAAEKPAPPPPPPDIEMGELAAPRAVPPSPSLDLLSTLSNMVLVSKRNVESAAPRAR